MDYRTAQMYELMRYESNRLRSFQMNPPWPKDYIDIKKLAKAGFFYVFSGDRVHCAFCRGQVCRWERDDDPMVEHARHFTTCPFIMGGDVGNVPLGEDPLPGPKRPRAYDVCGPYPSFPPDDPRSLEERYINLPNAEGAQSQRDYQGPACEDDTTTSSTASIVSTSSSASTFSSVTQAPATVTTTIMNPIETINSQESRDPLPSNVGPYTMENFANHFGNVSEPPNQTNSLGGICKICYTNSIELVFLPCGHSVSCLTCAHRLYNCPCCRETITTRIRTYLV